MTVRIRVTKPIRIEPFNAWSPRGVRARKEKILPPGEYTATRVITPVSGLRGFRVEMNNGWTYAFGDWEDGYEVIG